MKAFDADIPLPPSRPHQLPGLVSSLDVAFPTWGPMNMGA